MNRLEVIVVAPTEQMARKVAKHFGIARDKAITFGTHGHSLYGRSNVVILLYGRSMFKDEELLDRLINPILADGQSVLIEVPEYTLVNR